MANRYWVGGAGAVWNATVGTKWATTSGGAGGASVPTAADDVFFDANSLSNATSAGSIVCRSLNFTGYIKQFTFGNGVSLTIGDATAGASNVALKFASGMTVINSGATITLASTNGTQQTITSAGKTSPPLTINGAGSSYVLTDVLSTSTFTLTSGAFDTGNYNMSLSGGLSSTGNATRTLTLGTSTVTIGVGSATPWSLSGTNLTTSLASSTISLTSGTISTFSGDGRTYGNLVISFYDQLSFDWALALTGANTFSSITATEFSTGTGLPTLVLPASTITTVTGTFSMTGLSSGLIGLWSSSSGVRATLKCNSASKFLHDWINVKDIAFTGEAKQFATNSTDGGNNDNIRFNAVMPATQSLLGCGI